MSTQMSESEWRQLEAAHRERVTPWVKPRLERRSAGIKHPVDDFLFDYYPFSPSKLMSWHPGHGVTLAGNVRQFLVSPAYLRTAEGGATTSLEWLNHSRRAQLDAALRILEGTASRAPSTGCFGLHEWAMVYGVEQSDIRHEQVPLRLSPAAIKETVDSVGLRCTHLDAFRFFTPEAELLNVITPTRATQAENEQPGCLHASMDLYKYAFWFSPLIPSSLIADCFELARSARELDMRASPYDVSAFGLEPIAVETTEGRRHYADVQRTLMHRSAPLRSTLIEHLLQINAAVEHMQDATRAPST
ncbi:MAG: hypothetical protein RJB01_588 [Actinomycetota bacterium]